MRELKKLYQAFKSSGELTRLYPSLTGDWEKDKNDFKKYLNPAKKKFEEEVGDPEQ